MTHVAIYTRISLDPTGTQTATHRQETACRAFAQLREWDVVEVFEDVDLSAYQPGVQRPSYERMLEEVTRGSIDGILVLRGPRKSVQLS